MKDSAYKALLKLIDDPDETIYQAVKEKLLAYGMPVIEDLNKLQFFIDDELILERIQTLIQEIRFEEFKLKWTKFIQKEDQKLFDFIILLQQWYDSYFDIQRFQSTFNKIKQNIWIELNNYLTPLEEINVINSIFYNYYQFNGLQELENSTAHYSIHHLITTDQGNTYSLSLLYTALCEQLDIPIQLIDIPQHWVMAYCDEVYSFLSPTFNPIEQIHFYLDPLNGMLFTQMDVDVYLKRLNIEHPNEYCKPLSNKDSFKVYLEKMATAFSKSNDHLRSDQLQYLITTLI